MHNRAIKPYDIEIMENLCASVYVCEKCVSGRLSSNNSSIVSIINIGTTNNTTTNNPTTCWFISHSHNHL